MTQKTCNKAVEKDTFVVEFVPDWFVIPDIDDELITWCNEYKQRKAWTKQADK